MGHAGMCVCTGWCQCHGGGGGGAVGAMGGVHGVQLAAGLGVRALELLGVQAAA
jgi:hypothetical protein